MGSSSANTVARMAKRRDLTPEELAESARLKAIYEDRKAAAKARGQSLTQADVAERAGWSGQSAFSQYATGKIPLNLDAALTLARVLGCEVGEISPRLAKVMNIPSAAEVREAPNTEPAPANRGNIPLISWVQAGSFHEAVEAYAPGMAEKYLPCPVPHSDWTFALRVRGDSMFNPHGGKSFSEGDIIYCDPEVEAINRSFVVVKMVDEQEATFKQLVVEGTFRYLKALNPSWPEPFVRIDSEAVILGVVIAKLEQF